MRRRDLPAARAVGGFERGLEVRSGPPSGADIDQRADHRAHLPMQKRARPKLQSRIRSPSRRTSSLSSVRTGEAAWHCKSRKVEKSCRPRSTAPLPPSLRRRAAASHATPDPVERQRRAAVQDAIKIVRGRPRSGGRQSHRRRPRPTGWRRRGEQMGVEALRQAEAAPSRAQDRHARPAPWRERRHRCGPRHGPRPARLSSRKSRLPGPPARKTVLLPLPADEGRAVIFESELEAGHCGRSTEDRGGAVNRKSLRHHLPIRP